LLRVLTQNEERGLEQHRWDAQKFEHPFWGRRIFRRGIPHWRERYSCRVIRRWLRRGALDWRIQHDPLQWHTETAFGRALQTRWFVSPSVAPDFNLPAGNNVPTPAAKALFINRFPGMKNIQATEGMQSLLGRQV